MIFDEDKFYIVKVNFWSQDLSFYKQSVAKYF